MSNQLGSSPKDSEAPNAALTPDTVSALSSLSCDTLRTQHRLFMALHESRSLSETLRLCLDSALQVSGMECGGIYLEEPPHGLRLAHASGLSSSMFSAFGGHGEDMPLSRHVMNGTPLYGDQDAWQPELGERENQQGIKSFAILPLRHKQQVIGCVIVASSTVASLGQANRFAMETMAAIIGLLISETQADEALRASEARFEATFDQAAVGFAQVAPDGRWLRVNSKLCEIVGYSRKELMALDYQSITPDETVADDVESVRQLLAGEFDSYTKEKRYIRKDGRYVWINLTVSLVRKPSGEPDYLIAVIEDIQARKETEQTLRRFSRVVEQTASAIFITDSQGVIDYVNPRFIELSGYSAEEAIGSTPPVLLKSVFSSPEIERRLRKTIEEGRDWKGEICNYRRDGTPYWVSVIVSPVRDDEGKITNFVAIHDDISERKLAEAAFKESESALRKAQDMARIGNWKRDLRANTVVWSGMIYEIMGRDPALPPPTFEEMPQYFTPESWKQIWTELQRIIGDGSSYDVDAEVVRADGTRRWIHSHGEAGQDLDGNVIEINGMVQDITERKNAEHAQKRLARALKLLSQCRMTLVHADSEAQLLKDICRLCVDTGGYIMAWVGYAENDAAKTVRPVSSAGYDDGYLDGARITWSDTERGRGPTGTAIRDGVTVVNQDYQNNPNMAPWRTEGEKRGYQSNVALPLIVNRQVLGSLNIYASEPNSLGQDEVALLEELAGDLAYGIDALRTRIERMRAEVALADREAQYHAVIDSTTDGFWIIGPQGRFLEVNNAYIRRSGYSREELLSMRISDVEAQETSREVQAHLARIQSRGSDLFESLHRTKDGEVWPVEINTSYWPEAGGRTFVFVRDITQRKNLERQIIEVSTAEQERIGREIHDGVGQQLTAVGMLAGSLQRKLEQTRQPQEARAARELVHYIQELVGCTKSLSRGLSPIRIGPNGLPDALSVLVSGVKSWSGIACHLSVRGEVGNLDEITAVHLYRITQEAINNAIKHSHCDIIEVNLHSDAQRIILSIHDNGRGIEMKRKTSGLGLHIMRYRAGIIGANVSICPVTGGGTLVECIWNRPA